MAPCKPGKVRNPESGKCIDIGGPTYRKVFGNAPPPSSQEEFASKIAVAQRALARWKTKAKATMKTILVVEEELKKSLKRTEEVRKFSKEIDEEYKTIMANVKAAEEALEKLMKEEASTSRTKKTGAANEDQEAKREREHKERENREKKERENREKKERENRENKLRRAAADPCTPSLFPADMQDDIKFVRNSTTGDIDCRNKRKVLYRVHPDKMGKKTPEAAALAEQCFKFASNKFDKANC